MAGVGGETPEGEVGGGEGDELGDVGDGEAEAVVAGTAGDRAGANRDGDLDRNVDIGGDEGEEGGLLGGGLEVEDGCRTERSWLRLAAEGGGFGERSDGLIEPGGSGALGDSCDAVVVGGSRSEARECGAYFGRA